MWTVYAIYSQDVMADCLFQLCPKRDTFLFDFFLVFSKLKKVKNYMYQDHIFKPSISTHFLNIHGQNTNQIFNNNFTVKIILKTHIVSSPPLLTV